MILKHALRRFPNAKKVVYSTCSIYPEENEEVIQEVITQIKNYKLVDASSVLKGPWINFGSDKYGDIGKFCLYSKPEKDMCNGFFIAVFERLKDGEENKYLVSNPHYGNTGSNGQVFKGTEERKKSESIPDIEAYNEPKNKTKKQKNKRKKCTNIEDQQIININQEESKRNGHKMENVNNNDDSKDDLAQDNFLNDGDRNPKKKKKKKNKPELETENCKENRKLETKNNCSDEEIRMKKDKKKQRNKNVGDLNDDNVDQQIEHSDEICMKKKNKTEFEAVKYDKDQQLESCYNDEIYTKKDKKKKKNKTVDLNEKNVEQKLERSDEICTTNVEKKKKVKTRNEVIGENADQIMTENPKDCSEIYTKKSKKKKKINPTDDLIEQMVDQSITSTQDDYALNDDYVNTGKKKHKHSCDNSPTTEDADLCPLRKKKKKSSIDLDIHERDLKLVPEFEHIEKTKKIKKDRHS